MSAAGKPAVRLPQLARFGVVGLAATAVHASVYWALTRAGILPPVGATVAGFAAAFAISFVGHRYWTFAGHDAEWLASLLRFFATAMLGLGSNTLIAWQVQRWRLPPAEALWGIVLITPALVFACSKWWAFAAPRRRSPEIGAPVPAATSRALLWRRHWPFLAMLGLIAAVYGKWTFTEQIGQYNNDGPAYMVMAQHYASSPAANQAVHQAAATSRFPPLYPMALALSGGADNLLRAHLATTAFFIAALAVLYFWQIGEGMPAACSALLTALFAAQPGSWLTGLCIQSEYLYLLWSLLALSLLSLHGRRRDSLSLYAAAAAVAAATLTRTVGFTLLAPLLVAAVRAPRRTAAIAGAIGVLPMLEWHLLHRAHHAYSDVLPMVLRELPHGYIGMQLGKMLPALAAGFVDNLSQSRALLPLAGLMCAAAVAGAAWRLVRLAPDGIYWAAYLALMLAWPFPEDAQRFVWVLMPILLAQAVLAGLHLVRTKPRLRALPVALPSLALMALAAPALAGAVQRYRAAADSPIPGARGYQAWYTYGPAEAAHNVSAQIALIQGLRKIAADVPEGGCVIAIRPELINYYTQRLSEYPPLNSVPDPDFDAMLRAPGCRYVFMSTTYDNHFPDFMHPMSRLKDGAEKVDEGYARDYPPGTGDVAWVLVRLH